MTDIDKDMCRKAAAECVELARATTDLGKKEILLIRAQEWIKLAYAKSEVELEQHLAQMNTGQMTPATQRQPMQQQPVQQQQTKIEPENKE
jgi:hypothetical protein